MPRHKQSLISIVAIRFKILHAIMKTEILSIIDMRLKLFKEYINYVSDYLIYTEGGDSKQLYDYKHNGFIFNLDYSYDNFRSDYVYKYSFNEWLHHNNYSSLIL